MIVYVYGVCVCYDVIGYVYGVLYLGVIFYEVYCVEMDVRSFYNYIYECDK